MKPTPMVGKLLHLDRSGRDEACPRARPRNEERWRISSWIFYCCDFIHFNLSSSMQLPEARRKFIEGLGRLWQRLGISRTMAQVHALLPAGFHRAVEHGRRDGTAEHQPGQCEHEPAGADATGAW